MDEREIEREKRAGVPAGVAAVGAMVLPVLATVLPQLFVQGEANGTRGVLRAIAGSPAVFVAAGVLQAAGTALIAWVYLYLYRATKARRADTAPVVGVLAIVGPLLLAGVLLANQLAVVDVARTFTRDGGDVAVLLREGAVGFIRTFAFSGTLALGIATLLVSLNAMKTGLLSRFLGALGIAIGVISALPFGGALPLQAFWLGALALLFLDRWPNGRGPAWAAGEPRPWPPSQRGGRRGAAPPAPPEDEPARPRPTSRKRRRRVR